MLTFNFDYLEKSSKNSFCKNYTFENKNKPYLGTLFLILEIDALYSEARKTAEILSEILEHEYFKKEGDTGKNFEWALNRTNQAMTTLAEAGHIGWINKLHALAAIICNDQIHLSCAGRAQILLLRNEEIINIIEGLTLPPHPPSSPSPTKTFTNIISGALKNKDKLLFATPRFFEYFSQDKIRRNIQKSSPWQIRQSFLTDIASESLEPIALAFFEIHEKGQKEFSSPKSQIPKTLPSLDIPAAVSQKPPHYNNTLFDKTKIKSNLIKIKELIARNLKGVHNLTLSLFNKLKPKEKIKTAERTQVQFKVPGREKNPFLFYLLKYFKKIISFISLKLTRLTPLSRILLFVALLFIFAFIVNLVTTSIKKRENKINAQYENTLKTASEKEKQASDALIYNDYKKAKNLLLETREMIEKNILSSKEHKMKGEELLSKIQQNLDKADKIIRVLEPQILVDLETAKIEIDKLMGIDKNLYGYSAKKNTLYKLEEKTKEFTTIVSNNKLGKVNLITPNETKNSLFFLTEKPDLFEFDLDSKEFSDLDIAFGNEANQKDINVYMDKLYLLSPEDNQIYRHLRTISGYSKGTEWFSETKNLDIKNAVSFALDGSVYILKSSGQVLKFLNAEKEDFTMPELIIPISTPTKISTQVDYDFVYILEPKEKRILVLDKKGGLKNQYVADEFAQAKDIYVLEKEKKIYVLTEKKLLGVGLEK